MYRLQYMDKVYMQKTFHSHHFPMFSFTETSLHALGIVFRYSFSATEQSSSYS